MTCEIPDPSAEAGSDQRRIVKSRPAQLSSLQAEYIFTPMTRVRALIEVCIVLSVLFLPMVIRRAYSSAPQPPIGPELGPAVYLLAVVNGLVALGIIALLMRLGRHSWRGIGCRCSSLPRELFTAVVGLAAVYFFLILTLLIAAVIFFKHPDFMQNVAEDRVKIFKMFVPIHPALLAIFCLFVGFYEELFFRGFVLTRLRSVLGNLASRTVRGNWILPIIVSSAIFGLAHSYQGWLAMLQIFSLSLVFSAMFAIRGSIISPMLAHAAFDFISLFVAPRLLDALRQMEGFPNGI